ncbi:hypothetical protein OSCI_1460039 [Kamptonema sp. PCC 6506]|nr:hypothetical protein OSCI_1460039 [Kamptonema sp. PCC 6506]
MKPALMERLLTHIKKEFELNGDVQHYDLLEKTDNSVEVYLGLINSFFGLFVKQLIQLFSCF